MAKNATPSGPQLEARGYKVLRFWNNDVLTNLEGVLEVVRTELLRRAVR